MAGLRGAIEAGKLAAFAADFARRQGGSDSAEETVAAED
jgi:hypothetical protein